MLGPAVNRQPGFRRGLVEQSNAAKDNPDCWLAGWLVGWLAGWLTEWLAGLVVGWLTGLLGACMAVWLTGRLAGGSSCRAGWLAVWLAVWLLSTWLCLSVRLPGRLNRAGWLPAALLSVCL